MPEKIRFSNTAIGKLPEEASRKTVWDIGTRGLCLRGGKKKMFYVVKKFEGKILYIKLGEFPHMTVEKAREEANHILSEISKGTYHKSSEDSPGAKEQTLAWLTERYVSDRTTSQNPMKDSTATGILYHVKHYLPEWLGTPVVSITSDMIDQKYRALAAKTPTAAHTVFRNLRALMNYANALAPEDSPVFPLNPVNVLTRRRVWAVPEPRTRVLSGQEIAIFLRAMETRRTEAMNLKIYDSAITPAFLMFLLLTGGRKTEVATLVWQDVSFSEARVTFRNTKTADKRVIPVHEKLVEVLTDLQKNNGGGKFVFPGSGKTGHIVEYKTTLLGFFKNNPDFPVFSAHDLRRTFITVGKQVAAGDFVEVIVGHAIQTVTGQHYFHPSVEDLRDPMNLVVNKILSFVETARKSDIPDEAILGKERK